MKRVMIFCSSFFPTPYVSSVRMSQWARWLPEFGWSVIVVSKDYGFRELTDRQSIFTERTRPTTCFLNNVSNEVEQNTTSAQLLPSPTGRGWKLAIARTVGRHFLVPDSAALFWRRHRNRIMKLVSEYSPDAVITSSPSNSVHLVGKWIKAKTPEVPWLADFRDLYRRNGRYRVSSSELYWHIRACAHEQDVYRSADRMTCAIPVHLRWIRKLNQHAYEKAVLIPNGVPEQLRSSSLERWRDAGRANGGNIVVVGSAGDRELEALAHAIRALNGRGRGYKLRLVGTTNSNCVQLRDILHDNLEVVGSLPHGEALKEIGQSGILIAALTGERSRTFQLTSKLFEYLAVPVPVIVINPTRPDRNFFRSVAGLKMLASPTCDELAAAIEGHQHVDELMLQCRASTVYKSWSRREQSRLVASELHSICNR
jgi:hypothetical protein